MRQSAPESPKEVLEAVDGWIDNQVFKINLWICLPILVVAITCGCISNHVAVVEFGKPDPGYKWMIAGWSIAALILIPIFFTRRIFMKSNKLKLKQVSWLSKRIGEEGAHALRQFRVDRMQYHSGEAKRMEGMLHEMLQGWIPA